MHADEPKRLAVDSEASVAASPAATDGTERARELERLFREHNESLVGFLALRLRSRQEALEVAQEAYVRLLQLERPGVTSFLRAYLFRVASNLAVDRLRRRMTEARLSSVGLFDELQSTPEEPEAGLLQQQQVRDAQRFLAEVPAASRRAFVMFRIEEKSQQQIAAELGITDRMVRHHVTRVLVYLRLRFDGLSRDDAIARTGWKFT